MLQFIGGVMMMAGGGMLSTFGVFVARARPRAPVGPVGAALDLIYPADAEPLPADLLALLGHLS